MRVMILLFFLFLNSISVSASQPEENMEKGQAFWTETEEMNLLFDAEAQMEEYVDLYAIEEGLQNLVKNENFSFRDTVYRLIRGEISFQPEKIPELFSEYFLDELRLQKDMILQIMVIALAASVFSNFVRVFENHQIADISFYMMYLLISALLVRSFSSMSQIVSSTCRNIIEFMELLLPSYLVTIVLTSGSVTALGFYQIIVFAMQLLQILLLKLILPGIDFYLVLLILNQIAKEDFFSKFASLTETVIGWGSKSVLGIVIGLQAVQCLTAPAVDSVKNSALHRLAKSIPGIGSVLDAATETVAGSALIIKNAVGVAGILALMLLCLTPVVKLLVCILLFRFLSAVLQPVSEKRMVEVIESIAKGAVLLLRVLTVSVSVFVISLAMVTGSVKGG